MPAVQTVYPKVAENGGRPPISLERILRSYFLKLWFNLSDPTVEEALYDSVAMPKFVGVALGVKGAPDKTPACKFRHLLKPNKLGKAMLAMVGDRLHRSGIRITKGPSSAPRSSARRPRPKTRTVSATRRCIRRRIASSATSA
jgi:IS5 family transposase